MLFKTQNNWNNFYDLKNDKFSNMVNFWTSKKKKKKVVKTKFKVKSLKTREGPHKGRKGHFSHFQKIPKSYFPICLPISSPSGLSPTLPQWSSRSSIPTPRLITTFHATFIILIHKYYFKNYISTFVEPMIIFFVFYF